MTNHEKRALTAQGLDWRKVQQARIAAREMCTVTYELDELGQPVIPEGQPDRAIAIHAAAALDLAVNGRFTGTVTAPQDVLDRCARDTVAFGMKSLQEEPPTMPRVKRMSSIAKLMMLAAAVAPVEPERKP